jgi:hypothetical protein
MSDLLYDATTLSLFLLGSSLDSLYDLLDRLDGADNNGMSHVSDSKSTKWWVLVVTFDAHGLAWDELDNGSISSLNELGVFFHLLSTSS